MKKIEPAITVLWGLTCIGISAGIVLTFSLYVAAAEWFFLVFLRGFDASKVLYILGWILFVWAIVLSAKYIRGYLSES